MNFDGHVSGARNALSDHDFVNQNLHHFPCQMLYINVFFNQFSAVVTYSNFDFDLGNLFLTFEKERFKAFFLRDEVFRQLDKVCLADQPFNLVKIKVTHAFGKLIDFALIGHNFGFDFLLLRQKISIKLHFAL